LGFALPVSFAAVRVPLFFGQGLSLAIEAEEPIEASAVESWLREAPSLIVDPPASATTVRGAAGGEAVHVAAVRTDSADRRWLSLWATSDNVRQGAALAAVSIAEAMVRFRGAH
jgi:aspartate-semialdehyde dehydrogenase